MASRAGRVGEGVTARRLRLTLPPSNRRCGFPACGSPENPILRLAGLHVRTGNLHGELLSVHKISQAYPGIPTVRERLSNSAAAPQMIYFDSIGGFHESAAFSGCGHGRHHFPYRLFAAAQPKNATDRIILGPRKLEVSRMAMGTGTNGGNGSSNQTRRLGYHGVAELFRAAFDQGINFWDSADQYGSHTYIREALKTVPRDKVVILTKTNSTTAATVKADIDRYRRELGVDYIDILLLHAQQAADWNVRMRPCMDVIGEARDRGIVRSHGTSCHTLQALKTAAAEPWVEVDLARLNPAGLHMDSDPQTVIGVLRQMTVWGSESM